MSHEKLMEIRSKLLSIVFDENEVVPLDLMEEYLSLADGNNKENFLNQVQSYRNKFESEKEVLLKEKSELIDI